ncbi:PHP family Zn ribbon phosphoesterase [Novosphingobium chloroacetimidivorans]|uniref:PHP family Zn ribbon phosphoesterase n=1 Tax=Novosphingobium chloroacetimidivorans TaxID=1428314 RepID=A0A7W7KE84_9SPHN|nr:hypothetical protein [Novosphingobium chloroacetimidivorans]MBB4860619.1 PHP family Zn ribbon phosphoesterase [Novosphingobium chloroacetimidivorans]
MSGEGLGTKIGAAVRDAAGNQAEAYKKYAALLERFSKKEIEFVDFGRDALDIYADAVRDVSHVGGRITNDAVKTGISKVRSLRFVRASSAAAGDVADAIAADTNDAAAAVGSEASSVKG